MRFLIIGGCDAGFSAALRARELDSAADITLLLPEDFPDSFADLPFQAGEDLVSHRTEFEHIDVCPRRRATLLDASTKTVDVTVDGKQSKTLRYDKLLVATGALQAEPSIQGWRSPGVFLIQSVRDSLPIYRYIETAKPKRAVIAGTGFIGLEMAAALTRCGTR